MAEPGGEFGLKAIGQIAINVYDLNRATSFYREVLGMRLLFQVPNLAFFDCGGIRLMLSLPEKPEFDHAASILYFRVDDIRRTHEDLAAKGVKFRGEPHVVARLPDREIWMAFFDDSEGNVHAITSEAHKS
jgi:catechol 2,3-dioxygenase-like lactoylglutathione lyase family enzyme